MFPEVNHREYIQAAALKLKRRGCTISNILHVKQTMQTNTAVNSFVFQGRAILIIEQMFTLLMRM